VSIFRRKPKEDYGIDNEVYAQLIESGFEDKIESYFNAIRTREYNKLIKSDCNSVEQAGVLKGIEMCSQMFSKMNAFNRSKK